MRSTPRLDLHRHCSSLKIFIPAGASRRERMRAVILAGQYIAKARMREVCQNGKLYSCTTPEFCQGQCSQGKNPSARR